MTKSHFSKPQEDFLRAEPKSLLDRIGGALKGAAEEKKAEAEAQVKPAAQAMPDRIE